MWEPLSQVGGREVSVSGRRPATARLNTVISPAKLSEQSWPEPNPPPSQLGVGALSQRRLSPPLPAVGLLQAAFCWPAAFFHTSAVCEESCVSILPSLFPPVLLLPCIPTHPPAPPAEAQEARYRGN